MCLFLGTLNLLILPLPPLLITSRKFPTLSTMEIISLYTFLFPYPPPLLIPTLLYLTITTISHNIQKPFPYTISSGYTLLNSNHHYDRSSLY